MRCFIFFFKILRAANYRRINVVKLRQAEVNESIQSG